MFSKLEFIEESTSEIDIANLPRKIFARTNEISELKDTSKNNFIPVHRSESVEAQRSKLPIYAEEQCIMEAINDNFVCC